MKWFKEKEFACKCCGQLPPLARENVKALVAVILDPVREKLGMPVVVNSGYRCPKHNKEVGGVKNSQHLKGEAADIGPAGFKFDLRSSSFAPRKSSSELNSSLGLASVQDAGFKEALARLKQLIIENGRFDQLIDYGTFLHVSYKPAGGNRHQRLKKGGAGYELD